MNNASLSRGILLYLYWGTLWRQYVMFALYMHRMNATDALVAEITGCYRQYIPEEKAKELAEQRMVQWHKDYWRDERREHPFTKMVGRKMPAL